MAWSTLIDVLPPFLHFPLQIFAIVTTSTYIASIVTGNASHVDRAWSILPSLYTAYFALFPLWPSKQKWPLTPYVPQEVQDYAVERFGIDPTQDFSQRALIIVGLVGAWTVRQTYNSHRKGLYKSQAEDYRWNTVRKSIPGWAFQVLNLVFNALIRNLILLGLSLPTAFVVLAQPHPDILLTDVVLDVSALGILVIQFIADNQQWSFQQYKKSVLTSRKTTNYTPSKQWFGAKINWTPADAKRGFITKGLFAWVRHPNIWCEQEFWWVIGFFPVLAAPWFQSIIYPSKVFPSTDPIVFWSLLGPLALLFMLMATMELTEKISASKYPNYKYYQERLGMFMFSYTWRYEVALFLNKHTREKNAVIERALWAENKRN